VPLPFGASIALESLIALKDILPEAQDLSAPVSNMQFWQCSPVGTTLG